MKIFCRSKINMKDKHKMQALFLYDQKTNPVKKKKKKIQMH